MINTLWTDATLKDIQELPGAYAVYMTEHGLPEKFSEKSASCPIMDANQNLTSKNILLM